MLSLLEKERQCKWQQERTVTVLMLPQQCLGRASMWSVVEVASCEWCLSSRFSIHTHKNTYTHTFTEREREREEEQDHRRL